MDAVIPIRTGRPEGGLSHSSARLTFSLKLRCGRNALTPAGRADNVAGALVSLTQLG
jgi:hypothetical protein